MYTSPATRREFPSLVAFPQDPKEKERKENTTLKIYPPTQKNNREKQEEKIKRRLGEGEGAINIGEPPLPLPDPHPLPRQPISQPNATNP
jgi:hypothetical protein